MNKNYSTDAGRAPNFDTRRTQKFIETKWFYICLLFITIFNTSLFALSLPEFSLSPFTEIKYGQAFEYVYKYDKILSELVWDMKPVYFLGLESSVQWKKGLAVKVGGSYGLPMFTGLMEDSDWLNIKKDQDTAKTHFSQHNASLSSATEITISAGWNFSTENHGRGVVTFTPSVGYTYYSLKWNGQDGYLQHNGEIGGSYTSWKESQPKVPVQGIAISYQQNFYIPTFGLSSSFSPTQKFKTELGFTFSPFVSSHNIDRHYKPIELYDYRKSTRWNEYHDFLYNGTFFEPSLCASWIFSRNISIYFNAKKTVIANLRGNTGSISAESSNVSWDLQENGGGSGAALDTMSLRLGCVFLIR